MANPHLPTDYWDGTDHTVRYASVSPRRVTLARTAGVVGFLGCLALAIAAFAPRFAAHHDGAPVTEPAPLNARPPTPVTDSAPVAPLTAAPAVAPPPAELGEQAPGVTAPVSPPTAATSTESAPEAATASHTDAPPAEPTAQAPTSSANVHEPTPVNATPPAPAPAAATATATTHEVSTSVSAKAPVVTRRVAEPTLSPREIERRQQRYEMWLRQQGLERVH